MIENYSVTIASFAERHFIKSFARKYHSSWDVTLKTLLFQFERIDLLTQKDVAEIMVDKYPHKIVKSNFSVVGTRMSPKSSGNRCIVLVHEEKRTAYILLVYAKTDIRGQHETAWWAKVIRENYEECGSLL